MMKEWRSPVFEAFLPNQAAVLNLPEQPPDAAEEMPALTIGPGELLHGADQRPEVNPGDDVDGDDDECVNPPRRLPPMESHSVPPISDCLLSSYLTVREGI
jgi:hypothetical protein